MIWNKIFQKPANCLRTLGLCLLDPFYALCPDLFQYFPTLLLKCCKVHWNKNFNLRCLAGFRTPQCSVLFDTQILQLAVNLFSALQKIDGGTKARVALIGYNSFKLRATYRGSNMVEIQILHSKNGKRNETILKTFGNNLMREPMTWYKTFRLLLDPEPPRSNILVE